MSNDIVKAGQTYLVKSSNESLKKDAGRTLVTVGGGGIVLWVASGLLSFLPFVSLPILLVLSVVLGVWMWAK